MTSLPNSLAADLERISARFRMKRLVRGVLSVSAEPHASERAMRPTHYGRLPIRVPGERRWFPVETPPPDEAGNRKKQGQHSDRSTSSESGGFFRGILFKAGPKYASQQHRN